MALLVDPPQRDSADERPSAEAPPASDRTVADEAATAAPAVLTEQQVLPPGRAGATEPAEVAEVAETPEAAQRLAEPPLTACAPQPLIVVPPSLKFTLPVGLSPVTVAVNVTDCPAVDGFADEASAVELAVA